MFDLFISTKGPLLRTAHSINDSASRELNYFEFYLLKWTTYLRSIRKQLSLDVFILLKKRNKKIGIEK